MTYHQFISWKEDGHGSIISRMVISDSFAGIFADVSDSIEINGIIIDEISFTARPGTGGIENNIINFTISDYMLDEASVQAKNLILSAQSNNIFLAVFIDTNDVPDVDDDQFFGIISKQIESEDLVWNGEYYDMNPTPVRYYKLSAAPFGASVLTKFTMEDLVYGNEDEEISGISAEWETEHVKERPGYYYSVSKNRRTVFQDIFNLNSLLRVLADNLTAAINSKGLGAFNIVFDRSELPNNWHPARWALVPDSSGKSYSVREPKSSSTRSGTSVLAYDIFTHDKQTLFIDPDGKPDTLSETSIGIPSDEDTIQYYTQSIWLNYRIIKNLDNEPHHQSAEQFRITKFDNFVEFLEAIAKFFGVFIRFYWFNAEELRIKFVSREAVQNNKVLKIKTVSKADLKPTSTNIDEAKQKYLSRSWYHSLEGADLYRRQFNETTDYYPSERMQGLSFNDTFFTISPTVCLMPKMSQFALNKVYIPHNNALRPVTGSAPSQESKIANTAGLHTAVYLCADQGLYHEDFIYSPSHYWTPVGAMTAKVKGIDKTFYMMSDYVNYLNTYDSDYYYAEYNLEIPFFMWSKDSDDEKNWRDIQLLNRIEIDGVEWIIVDIKWNFAELKYSLKLQSKERYDFSKIVASLEKISLVGDYNGELPDSPNAVYSAGTVEEGVNSFDLVSLTELGTYERTMPQSDHYHRVEGIALLDGDGFLIKVQKSGTIFSINFPDRPLNTIVYLRNPAEVTPEPVNNWIDEPLTEKTAEEELILQVGKYVGFKTIELFTGFPVKMVLA
ncbi:MAG: hypothetical protein KIT33_15715 [Candidatus Kapabacteria bacterium]|nr:hypothetical protein [Ignavibacteriota bacterium]MCW5886418.1 hypothetical protein [Candidatus Kapabacteria bacterium]